MNKIPAGYRFTFMSHDLRDENPATIIKEGLTEVETNLFVEICEFIRGGTGLELDDLAQWRKNKVHTALLSILESYPTLFSPEKLTGFKEDLGLIVDFINESILGYPHSEDFNMRILYTYKVEDIPQDIFLNDVTYSFPKKKNVV